MSLTKVAIAGLSPEVGKTLLRNLLREFSGWEAKFPATRATDKQAS
jgi:hypothetical protein